MEKAHSEVLTSTKDPAKVLEDLLSGQTYLVCEKHTYFGKIPPLVTGCPSCWKVYYMVQLSQVPKDQQLERLEMLESSVHHAVELERQGLLDFQFSPSINIESNGVIN